MKQIDIVVSFNRRGKAEIFLGIGHERLQHKSKTFLKHYIRKYKRVITDNVRVLNNVSIQIHTIYRMFYFELDVKTNYKVRRNLNQFNDKFDFIFQKFEEGCQNAFALQSIEVCIKNLSDALYHLKKFSNKHKNYSLKHQVHAYEKMLFEMEKQFDIDMKSLDLSENYKKDNLKIVDSSKSQKSA